MQTDIAPPPAPAPALTSTPSELPNDVPHPEPQSQMAQAPAKSEAPKAISPKTTQKPLKTPRSNDVKLAILGTVIIVLALMVLAVYAYTKKS